jgi:hypothetical protein
MVLAGGRPERSNWYGNLQVHPAVGVALGFLPSVPTQRVLMAGESWRGLTEL